MLRFTLWIEFIKYRKIWENGLQMGVYFGSKNSYKYYLL